MSAQNVILNSLPSHTRAWEEGRELCANSSDIPAYMALIHQFNPVIVIWQIYDLTLKSPPGNVNLPYH